MLTNIGILNFINYVCLVSLFFIFMFFGCVVLISSNTVFRYLLIFRMGSLVHHGSKR